MRTALIALVAVALIGTAAFLLADEKVDHVPTAAAGSDVRAPDGEWIPSVQGDTAELWAVGDADPPASGKVARMIRRADADRILYLGDVYDTGTAADFKRWAKPWGSLVNRMAPTPGNHEWAKAGKGYDPYWQGVTGQKPPTFYAFDAGGWRILSANGEHEGAERATERWLADETRSGGNCRLAFWHRPRYTAGHHEGGNRFSTEYWEAIEGRARALVHGHDHNMQRFQTRDGMVQFISGAGGRKLYPVDEKNKRLAFSNEKRFGALRLRLSEGRLRWAFIAVGGRVLDDGSLTCRPA